VVPRTRIVRVAGIYSLGLLEFDSAYGLVALDFGERLMSRAEPDLIQIRVQVLNEAPAIAKQIRRRLEPATTRAIGPR
jgi:ABC-type lipoprotein release transport system permease subunit